MHSAQCSVPHGASTRPQSSWENEGELHGGSSKTKTQNYLTPFFPISSSPPFSTTQQHSNTHTTHTNVDTGATPTAVATRDTFLASDGARVTTEAGLQVSEPGRVVLLARASRSPDQKHLISRHAEVVKIGSRSNKQQGAFVHCAVPVLSSVYLASEMLCSSMRACLAKHMQGPPSPGAGQA